MSPCILPTQYPGDFILAAKGEDQFEVYLGRLRSPSGSRRAVGFFERVNRGAKAKWRRAAYSRSSGGSGGASVKAMTFHRRVIVKASIKKMTGQGYAAFRKHLDYIQRDGTDERGDRAETYGRGVEERELEAPELDRKDAVKSFAARCKDDRHHFRIVVSPEDGQKLQNLTDYTRDLVARMESDLDTKLDWVAANHYDTGQPHTHLIVRGVRDDGTDLIIPKKYISYTLRQRAQDLVQDELGPVNQKEGRVRLARSVDIRGATALDKSLQDRIEGGKLDMSKPVAPGRVWHRQLQVRRLRTLAAMGLAEPQGSGRWKIDQSFVTTLRDVGARAEMIKAVHRSLTKGGHEPGLITERNRFDPNRNNGLSVTGIVRNFGRPDDTREGGFVIVQSLHGAPVFAKVSEDEIFETLREGQVVTFQPHAKGARKIDHSIANFAKSHDGVYSEVRHATEGSSISPAYAKAHVRRLEALRRDKLVIRRPDGSWKIPKDYLERASTYEADRALRMPTSITRDSTQTLSQMERARGVTWLDKRLVEFGVEGVEDKAIATSLTSRRTALQKMGLQLGVEGRLPKSALTKLQDIDLQAASKSFQETYGKPYAALGKERNVEGVYRQSIERPSGKFAVVERAKDFTLVPWRPIMERRLGQSIAGRVSAGGISWDVTKQRGITR